MNVEIKISARTVNYKKRTASNLDYITHFCVCNKKFYTRLDYFIVCWKYQRRLYSIILSADGILSRLVSVKQSEELIHQAMGLIHTTWNFC